MKPDCTAIPSAVLMTMSAASGRPHECADIAAVVERVLAGDAAAFEQLVVRYERRVFSLAVKLLGCADDAEDAAQEVFFRMFKYMHRFDVRKPLEPWLMQMTVNVCRDIGRGRQRRWETFPAPLDSEMAAPDRSPDPHAGLTEQQQKRLLWKALDCLPRKERLALVLRDIDGLSTAEAARILGSSETTVRSQISRARIRMKLSIERLLGGRK